MLVKPTFFTFVRSRVENQDKCVMEFRIDIENFELSELSLKYFISQSDSIRFHKMIYRPLFCSNPRLCSNTLPGNYTLCE